MSHSLAINWHSSFTPSLFFVSISLDTFPFQDGNQEPRMLLQDLNHEKKSDRRKDIKARIEKNTSYVTLDHSNTITVSLSLSLNSRFVIIFCFLDLWSFFFSFDSNFFLPLLPSHSPPLSPWESFRKWIHMWDEWGIKDSWWESRFTRMEKFSLSPFSQTK